MRLPDRAPIEGGHLHGREVNIRLRPDGQPIFRLNGRDDGAGGVEICEDPAQLIEDAGWQVLWLVWPRVGPAPVFDWLGPYPLRDDPENE